MTIRNMYKLSMLEMNSILRPDNRIGGVMVSVLASSAVDRGFEYSAIFQLCHGENKLIFNEMKMRSTLY
jgi:hypothetical protein